MPHLTDEPHRAWVLMLAANELLLDRGVAALTIRNIARTSGVSTSSIYHQLDSRERLLSVTSGLFAEHRWRHLCHEARTDGAYALLPRHAPEVLATRLWLSWLEVWRGEPGLAPRAERAWRQDHDLLNIATRGSLSSAEEEATAALLDGLRMAVCAPADPMPLARAREVLARHLVPLTGEHPTPLSALEGHTGTDGTDGTDRYVALATPDSGHDHLWWLRPGALSHRRTSEPASSRTSESSASPTTSSAPVPPTGSSSSRVTA